MTTGIRVALGPSLSSLRKGLQERLGGKWQVDDLFSVRRSDGPARVMVIGTPEIPYGEVQVVHHENADSVLIGTALLQACRDATVRPMPPLESIADAVLGATVTPTPQHLE